MKSSVKRCIGIVLSGIVIGEVLFFVGGGVGFAIGGWKGAIIFAAVGYVIGGAVGCAIVALLWPRIKGFRFTKRA